MGCDIHMWVEYAPYSRADGSLSWRAFTDNFNPGRDYHMFNVMADCGRNDAGEVVQQFENRGWPDDVSWEAQEEADADIHSRSWLSHEEFSRCYAQRMLTDEWGPPDIGWEMVMVTMREFAERGVPVRLVFGFDN